MIPVKIKLPDCLVGDHWEGISIGPVLINGLQPTSILASCRMYFRDQTGGLAYGFKSVVTTGFGLITITNATTWMAQIPRQILPLVAGVYSWDFETTDALGVVQTFYGGRQTMIQDVTHD